MPSTRIGNDPSYFKGIGNQILNAYLTTANQYSTFPYQNDDYATFLAIAQKQQSEPDLEYYIGQLFNSAYVNFQVDSISQAIQNIKNVLASTGASQTYILGVIAGNLNNPSSYGSPMMNTTPTWNGVPVPSWSPIYQPAMPLVQYQGTDPSTNQTMIYQIDQDGYLFKRFNESSGGWDSSTSAPFDRPNDLTLLFGAAEQAQATDTLQSNGVITDVTPYITIGDEPNVSATSAIDLSTMLKPDDLNSVKQIFSNLPRSVLWQWFKDNVQQALPAGYTVDKKGIPTMFYNTGGMMIALPRTNVYGETPTTIKMMQDEVWSAFINLFNVANVAAIKVQMPFAPLNADTFWAWEAKKVDAFNAQATSDEMTTLETTMDSYIAAATPVDPKAAYLLEQYALLPKIGDMGLEISRQNAINELLKQKEYAAVQGIIDAYKYVHTTMLSDAITNPIPFDIVSSDGSLVQKTTTPTT